MMKMYYEWRSLSVGKIGKCRKMQLKFPNLSFPSFFFFSKSASEPDWSLCLAYSALYRPPLCWNNCQC